VDLTMALSRDAVLLRIFIGEDDKANHKPLYEAIVLKAREMHLAGATVLRGPMGFGHSSVLHTTKIVRLIVAGPAARHRDRRLRSEREDQWLQVDADQRGMMGKRAGKPPRKVERCQYGTVTCRVARSAPLAFRSARNWRASRGRSFESPLVAGAEVGRVEALPASCRRGEVVLWPEKCFVLVMVVGVAAAIAFHQLSAWSAH
jgi:hypothetical protein